MTDDRELYVVHPKVIVQRDGDAVTIKNPISGSTLHGAPAMLRILRYFETAADLEAIAAREPGSGPLLETLKSDLVLIKKSELDVLGHGFLRPSQLPIGRSCSLVGLREARATRGFAIAGVAVDMVSGGEGGARHGPLEIRRAWSLSLGGDAREDVVLDLDLRRRYDTKDLFVFDLGSVHYEIGEPFEILGRRIERAVEEICAASLTPILLGGDHSITWWPLKVMLARNPALGVIHFDAHHDMYTEHRAYLNHSNVFTHVLASPSLRTLVQIGLRTLERPERGTQPLIDPRLRYVSARELDRMSPEQVFGDLPRDIPYYVSFDVDCLSPSIARETGTRIPGGLTYYQALDLIDWLGRSLTIAGADFVEVSRGEGYNEAAAIVARYAATLILGSAKSEVLDSHVRSVISRASP